MVAPNGGTRRTRREVLAAGAATVAGGVAGCLDSGAGAVSVLSAGSLARTFEEHVGPAFESETGIELRGEYYGTNALIRMVEDRTKHPDVVVSADAALLRDRLYGSVTDWDVAFAANSLGIGYDTRTRLGSRLDAGDPWYELAPNADSDDISIADPDLDPLGYRAVQGFELAGRTHDLPTLKRRMLGIVYREPEEPQLVTGVTTGSRAAAIVYRNMAVDHGIGFSEFPAEYNFADPDLADHYATVEYTTDGGYTAPGRPILYNVTVCDDADAPAAGRRFVEFLADNPDRLTAAGLSVGEELPRAAGDIPEAIDP
ncbi:ABC transporter substrate-binding protein [Halobellus salinus]|uniref:ABC transporter substrate-binding protein n=1 Tax=Halobellus salinus TaxID=931585 RepID=A0A830E789_9EURY|nr:extracellular solute-binding protein [Halobellus salinus]GGI99073.1 ABC transporter substrate-binding protein [Halobellus salinus]SMP05159.1 tungstate/molybdate binding protein [Halobellus salinus]